MILSKIPQALGENETAINILKKALNISKKVFNNSHPQTAETLADLGVALIEKDKQEAKIILIKAVGRLEKALGKDHPTTLKYSKHLKEL